MCPRARDAICAGEFSSRGGRGAASEGGVRVLAACGAPVRPCPASLPVFTLCSFLFDPRASLWRSGCGSLACRVLRHGRVPRGAKVWVVCVCPDHTVRPRGAVPSASRSRAALATSATVACGWTCGSAVGAALASHLEPAALTGPWLSLLWWLGAKCVVTPVLPPRHPASWPLTRRVVAPNPQFCLWRRADPILRPAGFLWPWCRHRRSCEKFGLSLVSVSRNAGCCLKQPHVLD